MTSFAGGHDHLTGELHARFRHLHQNPPNWSWPFAPSTPLIGNAVQPGKSILVYASAENFSWMTRKNAPEWFNDERVWSRYRACYDARGKNSDAFFPNVGIQPVTDGGLFTAALFVASRLGLAAPETPRAFLETVAFTNWCKFTIKPGENGRVLNADYAGVESKMAESLAYVVTELAVLQPKVVLVPKAIWQRPLLQVSMRGASPFTQFVPIFQFNSTVVNCHLVAYSDRAARLKRRFAGKPLAQWMKNLYGFREEHAWRYVAFLDDVLTSAQ